MTNKYRYEIKFLIDSSEKYAIENHVKNNPKIFKEIFSKRYINNIYYDSRNLRNYHDNIDGHFYKKKIRVRWYGDISNISKPILEFKTKVGSLGQKSKYKLKNKLSNNTHLLLKDNKLPKKVLIDLKNVEPVIINRYNRKYFLSSDSFFRFTIDSNVKNFKVPNDSSLNNLTSYTYEKIILELKFDQIHYEKANLIIQHLPYRISTFSKYILGIQQIRKFI